MWETLTRLLQKAEKSADAAPQSPPVCGDLSGLEQEIRKLGKAQFKANALAEEQASRMEKALAAALAAQEQNTRLGKMGNEGHYAAAVKDLLAVMLPALDGVDNAIASGKRYLQKRDLAARKDDLTPAQAVLVSPADRAMLVGWLDGLRLVRERLLAILERGEITPIPTIGETFDPYRHVAVGTTDRLPDGIAAKPGVIVVEESTGYQSPSGVIRFAEVIVYRPQ